MNAPVRIAVFDVGKTNVKVALVDLAARREVAVTTAPNVVRRDGPYPHYDVEAIWRFFDRTMADLFRAERIDGLSITAHGASIVLLGDDALALPVLDYEFDGPDTVAAEYDALRPDFSETLSPRLPCGLTVGAQIHWLQSVFPEAFARTRHILTYPQYWAWRLTGIACNEVTSLGCHTDLWRPVERTWSSLVDRAGWSDLMAPVRSATTPLGSLNPALAHAWGLDPETPVVSGIHDSNASLLPHLLDHRAPFAVVSTGTWAISFAVGARPEGLDPARDTLANVNVFGDPVPSARFMGGRAFELLTDGAAAAPDRATVEEVLRSETMVLPAVVPESGPFQGRRSSWSHDPAGLTPEARTAVASLYLALMTDTCLDLIGAAGPVIVEGPFSGNALYCDALASLTGRGVAASTHSATGTSVGAALLFAADARDVAGSAPVPTTGGLEPDLADLLTAYAALWRRRTLEP